VRLAGCNLRCAWCDTAYAWQGGEERALAEIVDAVLTAGLARACVTGGEPLLQPETPDLVRALLARGVGVSVETNGTRPIADLDPRAARVVDWKAPSAFVPGAPKEPFAHENWALLGPGDALKVVVADRADYDAARRAILPHGLGARGVEILLSAAWGRLDPATLAGWLVRDRWAEARLNVQIHKVVFGVDARGV